MTRLRCYQSPILIAGCLIIAAAATYLVLRRDAPASSAVGRSPTAAPSAAPTQPTNPFADTTGTIVIRHTQAQIDGLVADLRSMDPARVVPALKQGQDILRPDFKQAVAACLAVDDPQVHSAAMDLILPCRITSEYSRLAAELGKQFPGRLIMQSDVGESPTDLWYPFGDLMSQMRQLGSGAVPVLIPMLRSNDPKTRLAAVTVLGQMGLPEAAAALRGVLSDPDPAIRQRAIRALGAIGSSEALDALNTLRNEDDIYLLREVAFALSRQSDERALPVWQKLLKSPHEIAGFEAAESVARFPYAKAVPVLIAGLENTSGRYRSQCLAELRKLTHWPLWDNPEGLRNWWNANKTKDQYEVLGQALAAKPTDAVLAAVALTGDPRAIPAVLASYGKVDDTTAGFPNERIDSAWAMRLLSGHSFVPEQDHYARPAGDDDGQRHLWQQWWQEHRDAMPRRSPAIHEFKPLTQVARIRFARSPWVSLALHAQFAFVAGDYLEVFDVTDPAHPEQVARYRGGGQQIAAVNNRLFIASVGLHVYRITAQGGLEYISSHTELTGQSHFMISSSRLLARDHQTIALYDISGPGAPKLLDTCAADALSDAVISGESGFFTVARWEGNQVIRTSGRSLAQVHNRADPSAIMADRDRLFYIDHGLLFVRRLTDGKVLGTAPARSAYGASLVVKDNRAYATSDKMGIVIYDVSDTSNITILSHTFLPGMHGAHPLHCCGFAVNDRHLFCVSDAGELFIFELPP